MPLNLVDVAKKFLIKPLAAVGHYISEGANTTVYGPNYRERAIQLQGERDARRRLVEANIHRIEAQAGDDLIDRQLKTLSLKDRLEEDASVAGEAQAAGMTVTGWKAHLRQLKREQESKLADSLIGQRGDSPLDLEKTRAEISKLNAEAAKARRPDPGGAGGLSGRFIPIIGADGQVSAWFPKTGGVSTPPAGTTFKPTDKEAEARSVARTTIERLGRLKQLLTETKFAGTGPYEGPLVAGTLSKLPEQSSKQILGDKYGPNYDKVIEIQSLARAINDDIARAKEGAVIPEAMMRRIERFSVSPDIQSDLLGNNIDRLLGTMQEIQGLRVHGGVPQEGGVETGLGAPPTPGQPKKRLVFDPATGELN